MENREIVQNVWNATVNLNPNATVSFKFFVSNTSITQLHNSVQMLAIVKWMEHECWVEKPFATRFFNFAQ